MSDRVIDAIRQVDPCPAELPAPPIESVLRRLGEEPVGEAPPASRWWRSAGALAAAVSSVVVIAIGVSAIVVLSHAHRAGLPAARQGPGTGAPLVCRPQVRDGVLPAWARGGFSSPRPRMPYALGVSGRIVAIIWGPLDSPPAPDVNNKILWVSRVSSSPGRGLSIEAQRMVGSKRLGAPVNRTVAGGPGPSIINLPSPGCWRFTLHWSGWTDHIDIRYKRPG